MEQDISPTQFEDMITELLKQMGFSNVERIGGPGDKNVDILAEKIIDGLGNIEKYAIQCKRYCNDSTIGPMPIRIFESTFKKFHNANRGIFITTSDFSDQAIEEAKEYDITLIDGEKLRILLQKYLSVDLSSALCNNFCTNCGEKLLQKAIYCPKCGEKRKKTEYPYQEYVSFPYYENQSISKGHFFSVQNIETHRDRPNMLEKMILNKIRQNISTQRDIKSNLKNIHRDEISRSIENLELNGFIKRDGLKVPILATDIGFISRKNYYLTSKAIEYLENGKCV